MRRATKMAEYADAIRASTPYRTNSRWNQRESADELGGRSEGQEHNVNRSATRRRPTRQTIE
jgi:hypothetical protein